jgi:predicted metal-dependent hydrolase
VPQSLAQLQLPFDLPPPPEKIGRVRQLRLSGDILNYRLVRSRRRSIGLLACAGELEVRAPRHAAIAEIEAFISEKESWIRRRLAGPRPTHFVWESGASLTWLGRKITLVQCHGEIGMWLSEGKLHFGIDDGASLRSRALEWMYAQARAFFRERVVALASPFGLLPSEVGLSNARTRWGSCGANGRLLLNWRLMLLPPRLIDYVAAHEIAHLRELNHSPRFWAIVASLYPHYRSARHELNAMGRMLPEL